MPNVNNHGCSNIWQTLKEQHEESLVRAIREI
jgi:hypothetical protein